VHSLVSDPLFINSSGSQAADFKLSQASPMQGYGTNLSALYSTDFFLDPLAPVPTPWDPGIHVVSGIQATPSQTPVQPTFTSTPPDSPTPTFTPTPSFTASPIGTATNTPSPTKTFTVTLTPSVTPYPIQSNRVITYPNPYRPRLGKQNIVFDTTADADVKIFDINGQLVQQLAAGSIQASLGHAVWDGRDKDGREVAPGLYFCVVHGGTFTHFTHFTVLY
jgi:hypothetical protein